MRKDPIVDEVRAHGRAFAAKHGNDLHRIVLALRERQAASHRNVVNRDAKRLTKKAAS